jgi:hypothetical protein
VREIQLSHRAASQNDAECHILLHRGLKKERAALLEPPSLVTCAKVSV